MKKIFISFLTTTIVLFFFCGSDGDDAAPSPSSINTTTNITNNTYQTTLSGIKYLYYDRDIIFLTQNSTGWEEETIVNDLVQETIITPIFMTALDIDINDKPHFLYNNIAEGKLYHSTIQAGLWSKKYLGKTSRYADIAFDSNNEIHVCFYNYSNSELTYAKWEGLEWDYFTFNSGGSSFPKIACDENDIAHIVYYDKSLSKLKHMGFTGSFGTAEYTTIDDSDCYATSLVLDASNTFYVSYIKTGSEYSLNLGSFDGTAWATGPIESFTSLAGTNELSTKLMVKSDNTKAIAYCSDSRIRYGSEDSSWTFEDIDTTGTSIVNVPMKTLDMDLDSSDNPHVLYYKGSTKYAYNDGSNWNIESLKGAQSIPGSIKLDSNDVPNIGLSTYEIVQDF